MFERMKKNIENYKKPLTVIAVLVLVLAIIIGGCFIYVFDYYRADVSAIAAFSESLDVKRTDIDGAVLFGDGNEKNGFIFYPGGKVEYKAYIPLIEFLASKDIFCAVVEMPLNLAVLGVDRADEIRDKYPEVEKWYIGGHSLGGSMAAGHLAENLDKYAGLVLLGSYSTEDLSESRLPVLSIFGSEDKVMNREKYESNKSNLPEDTEEIIIEGGNHAYFGMYGEQRGDGTASISASEQISLTAHYIHIFIGANK